MTPDQYIKAKADLANCNMYMDALEKHMGRARALGEAMKKDYDDLAKRAASITSAIKDHERGQQP